MSTVNQTETLNNLILSLEEKKKNQMNELKAQLHLTGESMKPANLIKSAASELTGNKHLKSYLIQAGMGLAVGFLTKKLMSKSKKQVSPVSHLADIGLAKLTFNKLSPKQLQLIKLVAPILFSLFLKYLKNRKQKA